MQPAASWSLVPLRLWPFSAIGEMRWCHLSCSKCNRVQGKSIDFGNMISDWHGRNQNHVLTRYLNRHLPYVRAVGKIFQSYRTYAGLILDSKVEPRVAHKSFLDISPQWSMATGCQMNSPVLVQPKLAQVGSNRSLLDSFCQATLRLARDHCLSAPNTKPGVISLRVAH